MKQYILSPFCRILKSIQSNQGGSNFVLSQSKTNRFLCLIPLHDKAKEEEYVFHSLNVFANPKHTSHGN